MKPVLVDCARHVPVASPKRRTEIHSGALRIVIVAAFAAIAGPAVAKSETAANSLEVVPQTVVLGQSNPSEFQIEPARVLEVLDVAWVLWEGSCLLFVHYCCNTRPVRHLMMRIAIG